MRKPESRRHCSQAIQRLAPTVVLHEPRSDGISMIMLQGEFRLTWREIREGDDVEHFRWKSVHSISPWLDDIALTVGKKKLLNDLSGT